MKILDDEGNENREGEVKRKILVYVCSSPSYAECVTFYNEKMLFIWFVYHILKIDLLQI